ncbi:peptide/nickel transport system permease protein [Lentzea atacamensis]|uniref:Peptide/nickel transport system permease protein n=2 Tax=Lentzea TaxID=165301 RepID=A0A316HVC4_9PSEU|nr:ABC transporter permease [Lentzea atacamensis]PWK85107.1 peptide/nickel transport system permease protein [Lentzea atacamensis]RAS66106.1 peptide/nickel transport system permease protein [Lentzea atacamensis]
MAGFLLRRLVNYVVLALVATFLAFTLASVTFDPIGVLQQRNPPPPAASIEAKKRDLHLDQPIPQRFVTWMGGVVQGDFGRTIADRPITDELGRRIGVSLRLFLLGITIGILFGVLLGVVSAIRQYKFSDYFATLFSFILLSTPVFVLGTLLKMGAQGINDSIGTNVLIFVGEQTPGFQGNWFEHLGDRLQHLIVPTLAIALGQIAYYSRYQRSSMLDVLGSDFLRTAQAKGLTRRKALFKHGLRTALIPMATLFAFGFGLLVVGGTFTERIFGWFGMGDWLVTGISAQDTNVTATVTLFVAVCVLFSGWLADVLYAALDPRIRVN